MGIPGIVTTPGDSRQAFADHAFEFPYERGGRALDEGRPRPLPVAKFPDKKVKKKDKDETAKGSRSTETFFPAAMFTDKAAPQIGDVTLLDLGGDGIRGMGWLPKITAT